MGFRVLLCHPGVQLAVSDVHDGLSGALRAEGVEVVGYNLYGRIEASAQYLNTAWAHTGVRPSDADINYHASCGILERALRHDVDWVIVVSAMYFHPDVFLLCRRAGIKVGVVLTESPYDDEHEGKVLRHVECAWTNERGSVEYLRQFNRDVWYLPHAHDPARHYPGRERQADVPSHDVVFVGTGFPERIEMLSAVDWSGIDLGLYGQWDWLAEDDPLRPYVKGGATANSSAAALYRKAKIGLNLYRTCRDFSQTAPRIEFAESLNPRAVELAACGVFTISDYRPEVEEVFGDLVPTFRSPAELEVLVRRWLADDEGRRRAAAGLPERVRGRTFEAMARQVLADLGAYERGERGGEDVPSHSDSARDADPTRQGHRQGVGNLVALPGRATPGVDGHA